MNQTRLTFRMALQLAAPHTWPAAIFPCLLALAAATTRCNTVSITLVVVLLVICVLMQSAVNALNDYYDYIKGSDSAIDNVDPSDATLVYNNVNPKSAQTLALGFLVAAFVLGIYPIVVAGWIPLAIALIGVIVTFLYSGGKTPLSYLPVGECMSGIVMGALIPLACYQVLTCEFEPLVLVWAIPEVIGIGLIMMTNNTCDIEKDALSGRRTLPLLLGRTQTKALYHVLLVIWCLGITVNTAIFFFNGLVILPLAFLATWPLLTALLKNPLIHETRQGAMAQICNVNIALGAFYATALFANGAAQLIL